MTSISLLTPAGFEQALVIERRCHAFPWTAGIFASNQGKHYLNFCLQTENVMAAFAITRQVFDEATLFNIAVDPAYQRRGFASQLLTHLIDTLRARDVTTLWLEVRASNKAAIALYEQFLFNPVDCRHGYYPAAQGREDAIVMALTL